MMTTPSIEELKKALDASIANSMQFCGSFKNLREMKQHVGRRMGNFGVCPIKDGTRIYIYDGQRFIILNETKTLKLVLKEKWYRMIECGEKLEEYRDIKPFYDRLFDGFVLYDKVTFYLGYKKNRPQMTFSVRGIHRGTGREQWGAEPGKEYYVIELGERL